MTQGKVDKPQAARCPKVTERRMHSHPRSHFRQRCMLVGGDIAARDRLVLNRAYHNGSYIMRTCERFIIGLAVACVPALGLAMPLLTAVPSANTVSTGQTFFIDISLEDVRSASTQPAIGAYQLDLRFSDSVVSFGAASIGDPSAGKSYLDIFGLGDIQNISPAATALNLLEVSLDSSGALEAGQPFGFELARVRFAAANPGIAEFSFANVVLSDDVGNPVTASLTGTQLNIMGTVPEPTTLKLVVGGLFVLIMLRLVSRGWSRNPLRDWKPPPSVGRSVSGQR